MSGRLWPLYPRNRGRPGRTVGESVGGVSEVDSSDGSNGFRFRYHAFDTRSDTESSLKAGKEIASHSPGRKLQVGGRVAQSILTFDSILPESCTFARILHSFEGCQRPVRVLPRAREEWGFICSARCIHIAESVDLLANCPAGFR